MPTLANITGASLSPDPTAFSSGLRGGFSLGDAISQRRQQEEDRLAQQQRQQQIGTYC